MKIHYEDEQYYIVEKKAGEFVHPYKQESNIKECLMKDLRDVVGHHVHPVNRLDRPTSGLVVFAKQREFVRPLQEIWHTDSIKKFYLALTRGIFKDKGEFTFDLNDFNKNPKPAITIYEPLKIFPHSTLVEVEIKTGRHHQIRRHFSRRVDHLLGDRKYGKKKYNDFYLENYGLNRLFLHSSKMIFTNPFTHNQNHIHSPLPEDLQSCLNKLNQEFSNE